MSDSEEEVMKICRSDSYEVEAPDEDCGEDDPVAYTSVQQGSGCDDHDDNRTTNVYDIIYDTRSLKNDLVGRMTGAVMFAQSSIIPSPANAIPGDVQPHIVGSREALLMFKPLQDIAVEQGVRVKVYQKGNAGDAFEVDMSPPSKLPLLAEQAQGAGDEFSFIEPASYSHEISSSDELQKFTDDTDGKTLTNILAQHQTVKIETADGKWSPKFYLPDNAPDFVNDNSCVTFVSQACYDSTVYYNGKTYVLKTGHKQMFKLIKSNDTRAWATMDDLNEKDVVKHFVAPSVNYTKVVSQQDEFNTMYLDYAGAQISEFLKDHDAIKFDIGNYRWLRKFYVPINDPSHDGKTLTFSTSAAYYSRIHIGDHAVTLHRPNILVYKNFNGRWVEWSDIAYHKIRYGENFWSCVLPRNVVQPGMKITFDSDGVTGNFNKAEVGGATEVLLHTIKLGMLTPHSSEDHHLQNPKFQRQYFDMIPTSRLVVSEYEPMTFDEIVLPNGTKYTDQSADKGGVYSGDMRQHIGKVLIALGIDDANYGINSSYPGEKSPYLCNQVTCTTMFGKYSNGVIRQGLSGGGGICSLNSTKGNEVSHELGHNWGMGHYPNKFDGSVHRPPNCINSTWGWDSNTNVFIPNFTKKLGSDSTDMYGKSQPAFKGRHTYNRDAMAGGYVTFSSVSNYTLHTPFTLNSVQERFESKPTFERSSKTGMIKWNEDTASMEPYAEFKIATPQECASESAMRNLLKKHRMIKVSFSDGNWGQDIIIPNASAKWKGKGILVHHQASQSSNFRINDNNQTLSTGDVIMVEPEKAFEIPVQNGKDLEEDYMRKLLAEKPVVNAQTWNGRWFGHCYLPGDAALDGALVGFESWAGWNSTIHYNGKTNTLRDGEKKSFKNTNGKWKIVDYEKDDFYYWKPTDEFSFDVVRPPIKFGVPVVTMVGYYDPESKINSYIYPPLHGSYGHIFEATSQDELKNSKCYATVNNAAGESLLFSLRSKRLDKDNMNRFHINIEASFKAIEMTITVDGREVAQRDIQQATKTLKYHVHGRPL